MKSAILLEAGDINGLSRCCYVFGAAVTGRAFPVNAVKKFGELGPRLTPPQMWCSKGEKTTTFDAAMKRFLVPDGNSHVWNAPAILAPGGVTRARGEGKSQIGL